VFIDSIDGTLARQIQIKVHAPQIDGGLMDNIVDFTTWTIAPLFWLYGTMHLPVWVLIVCATASLFGFQICLLKRRITSSPASPLTCVLLLFTFTCFIFQQAGLPLFYYSLQYQSFCQSNSSTPPVPGF